MDNLNEVLTRVQERISFIKEIDKLKLVLRRTKLMCCDRHENDAEHSWHLAVMALVLADLSNHKIDLLRTLKMILIHDIVEIDAGDSFIYGTDTKEEVYTKEVNAAKRIFGLLPKPQNEELLQLWLEFEENTSPEAKFARAIDRFEPLLQNMSNEGGTWREYNVSYDTVYQRKSVISEGSHLLWLYVRAQLKHAVTKGFLKE